MMPRPFVVLVTMGLLVGGLGSAIAAPPSAGAGPVAAIQAPADVTAPGPGGCVGCHQSAPAQATQPDPVPYPAQLPNEIAGRPLDSLRAVPVPTPDNLADFVADTTALTQLGKALFWDMQVGSDGRTACATCHYQAGADARTRNQLNPGGGGTGDTTFQVGTGPDYLLQPKDFPLTLHSSEDDPFAPRVTDANDIVGSQGVFNGIFKRVLNVPRERCKYIVDPVFHVGSVSTRQVTGRNAPSAVNAVFNFRNFWDGRANNIFNGVNPFGSRDLNARVWRVDSAGAPVPTAIAINNASLASQAVGPPGSSVEMACQNRSFAELGLKLTTSVLPPLGRQQVSATDSVLGRIARSTPKALHTGLKTTYLALIQKAFRPEWWKSSQSVVVDGGTYTVLQANFSLFWGLALQAYESTLVSDDSPADQYFAGNPDAMSFEAQQGLLVFEGRAGCVNCHSGPETTNASVSNVRSEHLEQMLMADGICRIYDNGFYNIGVRPSAEDVGVGGSDPFGNPLSETGMYLIGTMPEVGPPVQAVNCIDPAEEASVIGSFKVPTLRNVELTGPYFHNGGKATLMQVVDFYNRGGDFGADNVVDLAPDIHPLGLTAEEQDNLVAFLLALTDERVRWERAPFDHPALCVPNGGGNKPTPSTTICLPAVGTGGASAPLRPFLSLDPYQATP